MSYKDGELLVLPEYLVSKEEPVVEEKQEVAASESQAEKPPNKKKQRGRNKDRPPPIKFQRSARLCPTLNNVSPDREEVSKCVFPNCAFIHDVQSFMDSKPEDIGGECHVYKVFGRCPNGLTCRFARSHITDTFRNSVNSQVVSVSGGGARSQESNHLSKETRDLLRKKTYDFKATDKLVDQVFRDREQAINNGEPEAKKKKSLDDVEDSNEINEREVKKIDWTDKLYLAPLTTLGNLPFRRVCKKFGADITCGEMAMAMQLLQAHQPEWALVQRHESEDIFGIQLCGSSPHQLSRVAQLVEDGHINADFVDLNLGCPIDLVYKRGMGSGLMGRKKPLEVMVKSMSAIMSRPLTLKIRTGIYMDKRIAHSLAPNLRDWGASMLTLHGRSREQRYTKLADWDYIGEVAKAVAPVPLFGNGDIVNYQDYVAYKEKAGVAGIMIARGALIKPWVFTEIKEQRNWDISASERLDMIKDYVHYGLEHWGSDDKGIETTRRFLLEWLSFLHRYAPVGVLQNPPQRMNERVPKYRGRDDIETLLASPYCDDWIKITEMFLGKIPDMFAFEPKHKAHGYK